MTVPSDNSSAGSSANWLFKNKEHGKTSVAASLVWIPLLPDLSLLIYSTCMQASNAFYPNRERFYCGMLTLDLPELTSTFT